MIRILLISVLLLLSSSSHQAEASKKQEVGQFGELALRAEAWINPKFRDCFVGLIRRTYTESLDGHSRCAFFDLVTDSLDRFEGDLKLVEKVLCSPTAMQEMNKYAPSVPPSAPAPPSPRPAHGNIDRGLAKEAPTSPPLPSPSESVCASSEVLTQDATDIITGINYMTSIYETLNTYTNDLCEIETRTLQEELDVYYNDTDLSETLIGAGRMFVDYSTNKHNNEEYEDACTALNGNYKEVNFDARCEEITQKESTGSVSLLVAGHPRCYAKSCAEEDSHPLLRAFSLRETEIRNSDNVRNGGVRYTCLGYVVDEHESLCEITTSERVDTQNDIKVQKHSLQPEIKPDKFAGLITLSNVKAVDFPSSQGEEALVTDFEKTCKDSSRLNFYATLSSTIVCSDGADYSIPFKVSNFPTCLDSQGCGSLAAVKVAGSTIHYNSTESIDEGTLDAIMERFRDRMVELELLQDMNNAVTCASSGDVGAPGWVVAAIIAVAALSLAVAAIVTFLLVFTKKSSA